MDVEASMEASVEGLEEELHEEDGLEDSNCSLLLSNIHNDDESFPKLSPKELDQYLEVLMDKGIKYTDIKMEADEQVDGTQPAAVEAAGIPSPGSTPPPVTTNEKKALPAATKAAGNSSPGSTPPPARPVSNTGDGDVAKEKKAHALPAATKAAGIPSPGSTPPPVVTKEKQSQDIFAFESSDDEIRPPRIVLPKVLKKVKLETMSQNSQRQRTPSSANSRKRREGAEGIRGSADVYTTPSVKRRPAKSTLAEADGSSSNSPGGTSGSRGNNNQPITPEVQAERIHASIERSLGMKRIIETHDIDSVTFSDMLRSLSMKKVSALLPVLDLMTEDELVLEGFMNKGKILISDGNVRLKAMRHRYFAAWGTTSGRPYQMVRVALHPDSLDTSAFGSIHRSANGGKHNGVQKALHVSKLASKYGIQRGWKKVLILELVHKCLPSELYGKRVVQVGMRLVGDLKTAFEQLSADEDFAQSPTFDAYIRAVGQHATTADAMIVEYARDSKTAMDKKARKALLKELREKLNSVEEPLREVLEHLPRGFKMYPNAEIDKVVEALGEYKKASSTVRGLLRKQRPSYEVLIDEAKKKLAPPQHATVVATSPDNSKAKVVFVDYRVLKANAALTKRLLVPTMHVKLVVALDVYDDHVFGHSLERHVKVMQFVGAPVCIKDNLPDCIQPVTIAMFNPLDGCLFTTAQLEKQLKELRIPLQMQEKHLSGALNCTQFLFIGSSRKILGVAKQFDRKNFTLEFHPLYDTEGRLKAMIDNREVEPSHKLWSHEEGEEESQEQETQELEDTGIQMEEMMEVHHGEELEDGNESWELDSDPIV